MIEQERLKPLSKRSRFKKWLASIEWKLAIKTGIAASISLVLGFLFAHSFERPDILMSGFWSVLTAIVVMQAHLGGTYMAGWNRLLGVFIGSLAGGVFITYVGSNVLSLGVGVACTVLLCSLLNIKESIRIASMSTGLIILLAGVNPNVPPLIFSLFRFLDACLGIIVAIFVSHLIWPERAFANLRQNIARTLRLIGEYYRQSVSLDTDNVIIDEKLYDNLEDVLDKNEKFREDMRLEFLNKEEQHAEWILITEELENIVELITTMHVLPKEMLAKIFDDTLARSVQEMIEKTDLSFQNLEKKALGQSTTSSQAELEQARVALKDDLMRFRGTHTIRKFNLDDVENFYVFFYTLRSIATKSQKIETHLNNI